MRVTHGKTDTPKPIHGRFSNRTWLVNSRGERITPKFKMICDYRKDGFILYRTSVGYFLCHIMHNDIIFSNNYPNSDVNIYKVDEHMYKLVHNAFGWRVTLYTQYGREITDKYTCVRDIKSGLCATEYKGKYGFIDGDANEIVPFKYKHVEDFTDDGYAIVTYPDDMKTVIDTRGKELFDPVDAYRMDFLTPNLLKVNMRRGKVGVMDLEGNFIAEPVYDDLWMRSGHIQTKYGLKFGLITVTGEVEFECMYPEIIETPDKFVVQDFCKTEIKKTKEVNKKPKEEDK
ncbi:MAG: WG repeat-containing protein [Clostridia bacterium]|nr:WG repeat-containing protein [Clostridia bacterium]